MTDLEAEKVAKYLLTAESEATVRDMAGHVGDQIHAVLARNGMLMKSAGSAIGVGVLAAVQVLTDTVEFARRTMGQDDEAALIEGGVAKLFADEIGRASPIVLAHIKGSSRHD